MKPYSYASHLLVYSLISGQFTQDILWASSPFLGLDDGVKIEGEGGRWTVEGKRFAREKDLKLNWKRLTRLTSQ